MESIPASNAPSSDTGRLNETELESVVGGANRRAFDHIGNVLSTPPAGTTPPPGAAPATAKPFFDDMMEGSNI
jgi:hypothetical protein